MSAKVIDDVLLTGWDFLCTGRCEKPVEVRFLTKLLVEVADSIGVPSRPEEGWEDVYFLRRILYNLHLNGLLLLLLIRERVL